MEDWVPVLLETGMAGRLVKFGMGIVDISKIPCAKTDQNFSKFQLARNMFTLNPSPAKPRSHH
jgi:hypothetical protein